MYNYYNNPLPEKRSAWRSASEIQMAALEHEKRRYQMLHEYAAFVEPQVTSKENRQSGWMTLFRVPLRLLAILIG